MCTQETLPLFSFLLFNSPYLELGAGVRNFPPPSALDTMMISFRKTDFLELVSLRVLCRAVLILCIWRQPAKNNNNINDNLDFVWRGGRRRRRGEMAIVHCIGGCHRARTHTRLFWVRGASKRGEWNVRFFLGLPFYIFKLFFWRV